MAVGLGNQNPAVSMTLPRCEGFEVHSFLNGSSDETSSERTWREVREFQTFARMSKRLLGISHTKDRPVGNNLTILAETAEQGSDLGKQRNSVACIGLARP